MAQRLVQIAILSLVTACGAATPVSFRGGTRWTVPMVGPLDRGRIVVPVTIHGRGPYLFALDPSAPSLVDRAVAEDLGLYSDGVRGWVRLEGNQGRPTWSRPHEVLEMQIGTLAIRNTRLYSVPPGALSTPGGRVDGVIGRDLLTESIVIDVDRDAGFVALALTGHQPPFRAGARVVGTVLREELVVPVEVDGRAVELAVELGETHSAIPPWRARQLALPIAPDARPVLDALGTRTTAAGRAPVRRLAIAGLDAGPLDVLAYDPNVPSRTGFDGLLGNDVLAGFVVRIDQDRRRLSLAPRAGDLLAGRRARLARWGAAFAGCRLAGCAAAIVEPGGRALVLRPDPSAGVPAFEVFVEARDADGAPLGAALLRVALGREPVRIPLTDAHAAAATFVVVDASPFAAAPAAPAYGRAVVGGVGRTGGAAVPASTGRSIVKVVPSRG